MRRLWIDKIDRPIIDTKHFAVYRNRITKGVIEPVALVLLVPYMWVQMYLQVFILFFFLYIFWYDLKSTISHVETKVGFEQRSFQFIHGCHIIKNKVEPNYTCYVIKKISFTHWSCPRKGFMISIHQTFQKECTAQSQLVVVPILKLKMLSIWSIIYSRSWIHRVISAIRSESRGIKVIFSLSELKYKVHGALSHQVWHTVEKDSVLRFILKSEN